MATAEIRAGYKCIKSFVTTSGSGHTLEVKEFEKDQLVTSDIYAELSKAEQRNFVRNDDLLGKVYATERS